MDVDGKTQASFKTYSPEGMLLAEFDSETGARNVWYPNGQKKEEAESYDSPTKVWYDNGQLEAIYPSTHDEKASFDIWGRDGKRIEHRQRRGERSDNAWHIDTYGKDGDKASYDLTDTNNARNLSGRLTEYDVYEKDGNRHHYELEDGVFLGKMQDKREDPRLLSPAGLKALHQKWMAKGQTQEVPLEEQENEASAGLNLAQLKQAQGKTGGR